VLGNPVTCTFQHHDQRDSLLVGELAQAVPLVGGTGSDRAAEHGDVLRPSEGRPSIDPARTGHQRIAWDRRFVHCSDQTADLEESARIEQTLEPLPCVEPTPFVLALDACFSLAPPDLLQSRTPPVELVAHQPSIRLAHEQLATCPVGASMMVHQRDPTTLWLEPTPIR
jgi:hypothetical protein